ncbi:MAG: hypothetical protein Q4D04_08870 [Clostridia bacterium]|nr:hypothetical protein [Clostridia bacterium]
MRVFKRITAIILIAVLAVLLPISALAQTITASFGNLSGTRVTATFDYDDSLFSGKDTKLKPKLAIASVTLAASAHNESYIKNALNNMGFEDITSFNYNSGAFSADDNDYASYVLAGKDIVVGKRAYRLYVIAISGTQGYQWVSNFNMGSSNEHRGFSIAADRLMQSVSDYVKTDAKDSIFWIFGHSRGAAVGNIVGARLTAGNLGCKVFCYTSATPSTTRKKNLYGKGSLNNLFAINNPGDFITRIPLASWNYRVYGRSVNLSNKGKVFSRMKTGFAQFLGEAYAGQTPGTVQRMIAECRKYSPTLKHYTNAITFTNKQGTHNPYAYFSSLALVLSYGSEQRIGLQQMLNEIGNSQYAVNLTAMLVGLKLPCDRATLGNYLLSMDWRNLLAGMKGTAHAHSPEAYIAWVNALYG